MIYVGMHCFVLTFDQQFVTRACVWSSCRYFRSWNLNTWRKSSRRISSSRTSGLWCLTLESVCTGTLRASSCSAWTRPDGGRGTCVCVCVLVQLKCLRRHIQTLSFRPRHTIQRANKHGHPPPDALDSGNGTIWGFSHRSDVAKTLPLMVIIICLFSCFCSDLWMGSHVGKMSKHLRNIYWLKVNINNTW